jgi:hypothetical protein
MVGTLIVQEQQHEDYKEAAMDSYINACSQGVCHCAVSDEFFDKRPGVYSMCIYSGT